MNVALSRLRMQSSVGSRSSRPQVKNNGVMSGRDVHNSFRRLVNVFGAFELSVAFKIMHCRSKLSNSLQLAESAYELALNMSTLIGIQLG